jgi:transposase-like protein
MRRPAPFPFMPRRWYSDEERAAVLAALKANNGNLTRTAQQAGVPLSTLKEWRDNPDRAAPAELRNQKKEALKSLFEKCVRAYLGQAVTKAAVKATRGKDAVIAAATALDKYRLLNDEPTERTAHEFPNREQLRKLPYDELVRLHRETLGLSG